jgi:hypothetical protein
MATPTASRSFDAAPVPDEICGYPVDSALSAGGDDGLPPSYFAIGPGGRGVVLKPLESDCVLKGKGTLHPSIKERLSRVRELALAGVANLYGVERDRPEGGNDNSNPNGNGSAAARGASTAHVPGQAWLIWEYVPGQTFDDYAAAPGRTPREVVVAARELVLTVESLHLQGIVHGAIKCGNVIVAPGGSVRLTHVSPLLYTDPADDTRGVLELLLRTVRRRKEERTALGRLLSEAAGALASPGTVVHPSQTDPDAHAALRQLGARLAGLIEARGQSPQEPDGREARRAESGPRRRALLGAAVLLIAGAAAAYGVWHAIGRPQIPMPRAIQKLMVASLNDQAPMTNK